MTPECLRTESLDQEHYEPEHSSDETTNTIDLVNRMGGVISGMTINEDGSVSSVTLTSGVYSEDAHHEELEVNLQEYGVFEAYCPEGSYLNGVSMYKDTLQMDDYPECEDKKAKYDWANIYQIDCGYPSGYEWGECETLE